MVKEDTSPGQAGVGHLALGLAEGEQIYIGDDITVQYVRIQHGKARLLVTAPRHVPVDREEVRQSKIDEGVYPTFPGPGAHA